MRFVRGNLFESQAQALVNTVNCVGVMGKGIAHQFQRAYPAMFADYKRRCRAGDVRVGSMTTFSEAGKLIINFPTKQHWKARSRLEDIEAGLRALAALITSERIRSIAIPPLGCGNGGLDWSDVRPAIERALGTLADVEIEVYEPAGSFRSSVAAEPRVTLGHFVLAGLAIRVRHGGVRLQKAAYFFNVFSGEAYFRFVAGRFGPYFVAMEPMLRELADFREYAGLTHHAVVDEGLRRRLSGSDADRLRAWLPVLDRTGEFVARNADTIEALATAHAVVAQNPGATTDLIVERFLAWSTEKAERFTREDVVAALERLGTERLIVRSLYGHQLARPTETATKLTAPAS